MPIVSIGHRIYHTKTRVLHLDSDIITRIQLEQRAMYHISVDFEFFQKDIRRSFHNSSVQKQFEMDLPRSQLYFQGLRMTDPLLLSLVLYNVYDVSIVKRLMMMTTQAVLGLPLDILMQQLDTEKYHILENNADQLRPMIIEVSCVEKSFRIVISKTLRICSYCTDALKTVAIVHIQMIIDLHIEEVQIILKLNKI